MYFRFHCYQAVRIIFFNSGDLSYKARSEVGLYRIILIL